MQPETLLFPVVTHTVQSNARTGIQAVTRGLCGGLHELGRLVPLAWHSRRRYLHPLKPDWARNLGDYDFPYRLPCSWRDLREWPAMLLSSGRQSHTPLQFHPTYRRQLEGAWMLLPELMAGSVARAMIRYARRHGMKVAVIFHDAIPLLRPELTERTPAAHTDYMRALADADLILPVSDVSAQELRQFFEQWKIAPPEIRVCALPAEFPSQPRVLSGRPARTDGAEMLCVSTLEPRKNHRGLIESFLMAQARHPKLTLRLVGDVYDAKPEIAEFVRNTAAAHPAISWHANPDAETLARFYEACDWTVYPSYLEGFGLPILESLWFARPCVCADFGVMRENAEGGGCLTTDVRNPAALAAAMERLAMDTNFRLQLAREAISRPLATWHDYAATITTALTNRSSATAPHDHEFAAR